MKGFVRPKRTTLSSSAQIPKGNLRRPPERFTHILTTEQPYFYDAEAQGEPAGTLPEGTMVERLFERGGVSRVVDSRGLSVFVSRDALSEVAGDDPRRSGGKT